MTTKQQMRDMLRVMEGEDGLSISDGATAYARWLETQTVFDVSDGSRDNATFYFALDAMRANDVKQLRSVLSRADTIVRDAILDFVHPQLWEELGFRTLQSMDRLGQRYSDHIKGIAENVHPRPNNPKLKKLLSEVASEYVKDLVELHTNIYRDQNDGADMPHDEMVTSVQEYAAGDFLEGDAVYKQLNDAVREAIRTLVV